MLATVLAATLRGLEGRPVRVEVDVAPGLPGFTIVGLADSALRESRERVRGALRNAGFVHPPRRITVNLAPGMSRRRARRWTWGSRSPSWSARSRSTRVAGGRCWGSWGSAGRSGPCPDCCR